jgi:hypothetical protein
MKEIKIRLILPLLIISSLSNCKSYKYSNVHADKDSISQKLVALDIKIGDDYGVGRESNELLQHYPNVRRWMDMNSISNNSYKKILFNEEIEQNVSNPFGKRYGTIVMNQNIIKYKKNDMLASVNWGFSFYPLFKALLSGSGTYHIYNFPWLFGFPDAYYKLDVAVEYRITNLKNELIAKYNSVGSAKAPIALYWGYRRKKAKNKIYVEALKDAFKELRQQIEKDAVKINSELVKSSM